MVSPPQVQSQDWWRIESDRFVIYTDVQQSDALSLAEHLSSLHELAPHFLPDSPEDEAHHSTPRRDLELLVFARRRDFARLLDPQFFAAFTQPGLDSTLLMVAPSGNKDTLYANLRHEYAHYHLRKQGLYYPPWFDEGMASLFEHVQVEADGRARLDSDGLFSRYAEPLRDSGQLSFQRLLSATTFQHWSLQRLQRFYGLSGQLVHFFEFAPERGFTDRREQLQKFLTSGAHDLPASLGISTHQLEREFRRYRSVSGKPKPTVTLDQRIATPSITAMRPAEVLSVQGRAAEAANPKQALARFKQAAELAPLDEEKWVDVSRAYLASDQPEQATAALLRAQEIAPHAASVRIAQATLLLQNCRLPVRGGCNADWRQASDIIHEALAEDPDRLGGVYLLGLVDLYRGRPDLAANYLRVVHRYAPWVPQVNYHLGECLRLLGDSRARPYLSNARNWAHEDIWRDAAEASLAVLDEGS